MFSFDTSPPKSMTWEEKLFDIHRSRGGRGLLIVHSRDYSFEALILVVEHCKF